MFRVNTSKLVGAKSATSHQYNKENKVLIICGPTATGKTKFALEMAKEFNGELVSADSQQVHQGKDIITGKDLPPESTWVNTKPGHYDLGYTKIWLYDVVSTTKEFSVALWHDLAIQVIEDILSRQKLPIVVGGTGLYLKSLTHQLTDIKAPRDERLRQELSDKDANYLFNYLNRLDAGRAHKLNPSDRQNPRRLIRAIEIAQSQKDTPFKSTERSILNILQIGLTAPRDELYRRIDQRVEERITAGAAGEDSILSANPQLWRNLEHKIVRQQLTWFTTQPGVTWFDVSGKLWSTQVRRLVQKWYNTSDAKKG